MTCIFKPTSLQIGNKHSFNNQDNEAVMNSGRTQTLCLAPCSTAGVVTWQGRVLSLGGLLGLAGRTHRHHIHTQCVFLFT